MGRTHSIKGTAVYSLFGTLVYCAVLYYTGTYDLQGIAIASPLFFLLFFGTMLASNRISAALARRVAARRGNAEAASKGAAVTPPTSDRLEHNQRRRQRAERARAERRDRRK